MPSNPVYTHGHAESVLRSHRTRTAQNSAAYLLPRLRPGLDLLDIGSGPGTITVDLAERVAPGRVTAVEVSEAALAITRAEVERRGVQTVDFAVDDVHELQFPADSFDVVHAHQVLQHVPDPVRALREMIRVCRPGGVVAVRDGDYHAFTWYPALPGLDRWQELYQAAARANGGEPDAGIWELDNRRWAHSRLTCAAGLRAIAAAAPASQGAAWSGLADSLVADVSADCLHPSGRFQRAPDDERVDAALLLPIIRGAVPADDPRALATIEAVATDLGREGFLYRYREDERPLGQAEGAFLLCGFAMALTEHQHGREVEAARWFERNRAACGTPGLLTEEYDVNQRQVRGNAPQAFVHALLFEAAQRLAAPWHGGA